MTPYTAVAVAVLVSISLCLGCGSQSHNEINASDTPLKALRELPSGPSIEEVEDKLGAPDTQFKTGSEVTLHYPMWHLTFVDGSLEYVYHEVWIGSRKKKKKPKKFTQVVLKLHRGMPRNQVEERLGRPTSYDQVFTESFGHPSEVVLRYDNWQLVFVDGRLDLRTKF